MRVQAMKRAVAIGCLTAILLTLCRGGSIDSIWIPFFFGVLGFLGTMLISYSVRHDLSEDVGEAKEKHLYMTWIRDVVALAIAVSFVVWSGPLAFSALYAGWLVAILLVIAGSLVVCLVSAHWPIAFGILVATSINISIVLQNASWSHAHGNPRFWEEFWSGEYKHFLMIWVIFTGLSFVVSIPFHLRRRRASQNSTHVNRIESIAE